MHSKVIIASLVCALAAGFGNTNHYNNKELSKAVESNESLYHAPNDEIGYFENPFPYFGVTGANFDATYYCENSSLDDLCVIEKSDSLLVSQDICNGKKVLTIRNSGGAGDYFLTFGSKFKNSDSIGNLYLHSDGEHDVISNVSADDARSKMYFCYKASDLYKSYLLGEDYSGGLFDDDDIIVEPGPDFPGPIFQPRFKSLNWNEPKRNNDFGTIYQPDPFLFYLPTIEDALKEYTDYVYSESNDITVQVSKNDKTIGYDWTYGVFDHFAGLYGEDTTEIKIVAKWFDESGIGHPLRGIKAEIMMGTYSLGNCTTDDYGVCKFYASSAQSYPYTLGKIIVKLSTESTAVNLKDNFNLNYPFIYRNLDHCTENEASLNLSEYKSIDYDINIYPNRSNRAAAYEICQAEMLTYNYCKKHTGFINPANAVYPANYSAFENFKIKIKEEDYNNWDLLNHEYGHYICNDLHLCARPYGISSHSAYDDLIDKLGVENGLKLALFEGLATYLGISSQIYASVSNIDGVGDKVYEDNVRHIYIDYSANNPIAVGYASFHREGNEIGVAKLLFELLEIVSLYSESATIGHRIIWDTLITGVDASNPRSSIYDIINSLLALDLDTETRIAITSMLQDEVQEFENLHQESQIAEWTIMIYMCGSNLEVEEPYCWAFATMNIDEILSVDNQPDDVNVIIQTGGAEEWYHNAIPSDRISRFHVKNKQLISDVDPLNPLGQANMGDQETFESFLDWGLSMYPARKTGVIIWNHGRALDGCCFDMNYPGYSLKSTDTSEAFSNVFSAHGINKLEFIGYDCCLMQVQDVAEFNAPYFKYMIASEELESAFSWRYDKWLKRLYRHENIESVFTSICDSFVDEYDPDYTSIEKYKVSPDTGIETQPQTSGLCVTFQTLSVLDLSRMTSYYETFENLALKIKTTVDANYDAFLSVIADAGKFGYPDGLEPYDECGTIDGKDFLIKLRNNSAFSAFYDDINSVIDEYNKIVMMNFNGSGISNYSGAASGLAFHVWTPNTHQNYEIEQTHFVNWRNLFGPHTRVHDYSAGGTYIDRTSHVEFCECGASRVADHLFDNVWYVGPRTYRHCAICNVTLEY